MSHDLRALVAFVLFQNREKHSWSSVLISKVAGTKSNVFHVFQIMQMVPNHATSHISSNVFAVKVMKSRKNWISKHLFSLIDLNNINKKIGPMFSYPCDVIWRVSLSLAPYFAKFVFKSKHTFFTSNFTTSLNHKIDDF